MRKPVLILCMLLGVLCPAVEGRVRSHLKHPDDWYRGEEARKIAANVLSWQSEAGGWPKNTDTDAKPYTGPRDRLSPTFDNGATTDELRFLARMFGATGEARYREAFLKGLDYILNAQYPGGGWPQQFPTGTQYHRHITFNDGAMVRLMNFVREAAAAPAHSFLDEARRARCMQAFEKGVQCILDCQIRVDGRLTAWCAQHDEKTLQPASARTYELASLSGAESVEIVRLLMSIEKPSPRVIEAVEAAVAWFESAKLKGIRVEVRPDPSSPSGTDKIVVQDPAAPPMWARFYEIGTNRPIFCDRDGVPKHNLADIGYERRNGYSWLGYYAQDLLAKDYPAWRSRHRQ